MNQKLGFEIPIIQAPMAGGITTPQLVAAVSNSGALGSLGAGYLLPDEMRLSIQKIKALTNKPFNVNLFIPEKTQSHKDFSPMIELLSSFWSEFSDKPFETPSFSSPSLEDQVNVLLEEKVPIMSFTFGLLPKKMIEKFKKANTRLFGTATTPEEAKQLEQLGVDAIVCQGQEAGGHRGCFSSIDPFYSLFPLLKLVKKEVQIPLIAAGGIMDGHSASAALLAGAHAVQLGTAFITVTESDAHEVYKKTLLTSTKPTLLTKAFTGKNGRGVMNDLMLKLKNHLIPPYPIQHHLTQKIRSLAAQQNRPDWMSLWAGQGYPLCQTLSASELVNQIAKELKPL